MKRLLMILLVAMVLAAHGEQLTALEDKISHLAGAVVMDAVVKAMSQQDGA